MSKLGAGVTGERYSGIGACHWCGASLPGFVEAPYCSPEHRRLARQAVDAGIRRELPGTFLAAVRQRAAATPAAERKRRGKATKGNPDPNPRRRALG